MATTARSRAQILREFDELPDTATVRHPIPEIVLGCSRATVNRHIKAGRLAHIKLGSDSSMTLVRVSDLRRLLAGGSHERR